MDFESRGAAVGDEDRYGVVTRREHLVARGVDDGDEIGGEPNFGPTADQFRLTDFFQPFVTTVALQIAVQCA
jgi:hypothetical protein